MRKFIILFFTIFLLLFTTVTNAQTSSIRGGVGFLEDKDICAATVCLGGTLNTDKPYFLQVSPYTFEGDSKDSKLGYRIEPFFGYSRVNQDTSALGVGEIILDTDIMQFGSNFLLKYQVTESASIYAGPSVGVERKKLTAKALGGEVSDTATDLFWGAEVGGDIKLTKSFGLGSFVTFVSHSESNYEFFNTKIVQDLGNEIKTGIKATYYWN